MVSFFLVFKTPSVYKKSNKANKAILCTIIILQGEFLLKIYCCFYFSSVLNTCGFLLGHCLHKCTCQRSQQFNSGRFTIDYDESCATMSDHRSRAISSGVGSISLSDAPECTHSTQITHPECLEL